MHRQKPDGWLAWCADKATGREGASVGLHCSCWIASWNLVQIAMAMECAVYQEGVSSGSPGGNKSTANPPQLRVGGTLNYFPYFISSVQYISGILLPAEVFFFSTYRGLDVYIMLCYFPFLLCCLFFLHITFCMSGNPMGSCMCRTILPVAMGAQTKESIEEWFVL